MSIASAMIAALNNDVQSRIQYLLIKSAIAVMAEVNTIPGHTARVIYSNKILSGQADINEASVAVFTNATVAAAGFSAADADLEFAVTSMFNALAGVST